MGRISIGRFLGALFLLPVAIALTSGAARAQPTSAATEATPATAPPAGATTPPCTVVHVVAPGGLGGGLHGAGDHVILRGDCDETVAKPKLLKDNPNWQVNMRPSYDLPAGTKVTYAYDAPSGNCIYNWSTWTETVDATGQGDRGEFRHMFTTVVGNPITERCPWERSYGSWNITAVTPAGVTKTANIRIMTGLPNIYSHYAEVQCHFVQGLACTGGSHTQPATFGGVPSPPLRLGPIDSAPPPRAPELMCTGTAHFAIGKAMDNHHVCTIEGYPRPSLDVQGLPAGVTAARWPTPNDTWIVVNGTPSSKSMTPVTVKASLPSGWQDTKTFWIEVK